MSRLRLVRDERGSALPHVAHDGAWRSYDLCAMDRNRKHSGADEKMNIHTHASDNCAKDLD
jgi:hypothetical protein